jgi:hypothetical protein
MDCCLRMFRHISFPVKPVCRRGGPACPPRATTWARPYKPPTSRHDYTTGAMVIPPQNAEHPVDAVSARERRRPERQRRAFPRTRSGKAGSLRERPEHWIPPPPTPCGSYWSYTANLIAPVKSHRVLLTVPRSWRIMVCAGIQVPTVTALSGEHNENHHPLERCVDERPVSCSR